MMTSDIFMTIVVPAWYVQMGCLWWVTKRLKSAHTATHQQMGEPSFVKFLTVPITTRFHYLKYLMLRTHRQLNDGPLSITSDVQLLAGLVFWAGLIAVLFHRS